MKKKSSSPVLKMISSPVLKMLSAVSSNWSGCPEDKTTFRFFFNNRSHPGVIRPLLDMFESNALDIRRARERSLATKELMRQLYLHTHKSDVPIPRILKELCMFSRCFTKWNHHTPLRVLYEEVASEWQSLPLRFQGLFMRIFLELQGTYDGSLQTDSLFAIDHYVDGQIWFRVQERNMTIDLTSSSSEDDNNMSDDDTNMEN